MRIQCALIAFTLHFSRNRMSTLRLRMSRDCHARAVLLVKNGSSTIDKRDGVNHQINLEHHYNVHIQCYVGIIRDLN